MNTKEIEALEFATKKHEGQTRKEGIPYITHPMAVADIVKEWGYGQDYIITAYFHDLLEDTDTTEEEIKKIGGPKVLEAVKLMTKEDGWDEAQYIQRIKNNPIAKAVKAADRTHNLKSAIHADEGFRKRYIKDTMQWYLDFRPEIRDLVDDLAKSMNTTVEEVLNEDK